MSHCVNLTAHLTAIRVTGDDAARFLQAQLTCDIDALLPTQNPSSILLGAWCNPKGRVIATIYVLFVNGDHWLVIPSTLQDTVLARLRLFVMRSKVILSTDERSRIKGRIAAVGGPQCTDCETLSWHTLPNSNRQISITVDSTDLPVHHCSDDPTDWLAQRIADGEAFVDEQTSELFLPEHLNLDLTGAVSFTKGCYPGQEVVARMHYKGKQKTRLFCAQTTAETSMCPGAKLFNQADKAVGNVVESITVGNSAFATVTAPANSLEDGAEAVSPQDAPALALSAPHSTDVSKVSLS